LYTTADLIATAVVKYAEGEYEENTASVLVMAARSLLRFFDGD